MIKTWSITDIGLVRNENQDAFRIAEQNGTVICVVCDGMGGAAGGRIASETASRVYVEELSKIVRPDMTSEQLREASSYAASLANRAVAEAARTHEGMENMGTTLVSAVSYAGGAVVTNIGDSRAYHISEAGIVRVTKDHSLVESMVDHGDITSDEARHHPSRNLVTRVLGLGTDASCDGFICPVAAGEFLLLCTDGLVNTVTDQEMLFEILHGEKPDTALERLLQIAKRRGAPDNVTGVLMQML